MILSDYILAIKIAIIAYVYSDVLTEPGMIFNGLFKLIDRLPEWLSKPLIGCHLCVSGQMALWVHLAVKFKSYSGANGIELPSLIFNHIFFISLTIIITWIINKIMR